MTTALRVLVVDDERISRESTRQQLKVAGWVADAVPSAFVALERLAEGRWDVVLSDLRMPGMDGLAFLKEVRRLHPGVAVILMTAYGTVETAVSAMHDGAADYLTKPFRFAELELRLRRLEEVVASRSELGRLRALLDDGGAGSPALRRAGILGRAPGILRAGERIELYAETSAPVLVTGETGTGKELVASAIHALGPRRREPFVVVACGALARDGVDSHLFGHEKGALAGAFARKRGAFEEAGGGTVLLDEVSELPLDAQVKVLRLMQDGKVRRVGGDEDVLLPVRVIATSKVDLATAVTEGRFRDDLYYRLRGLEIALPPLRDRGDDLLLLAQHFLKVLAASAGQAPKTLDADVAAVLRRYPWPGNVRELRRTIESAVAIAREPEIKLTHLPDYLTAEVSASRLFSLHLSEASKVNLAELVMRFEDEVIAWALRQAHGQQARAAELLSVPRTTLQSKLGRGHG
jgi:DNA-binding NtrC family response regulator